MKVKTKVEGDDACLSCQKACQILSYSGNLEAIQSKVDWALAHVKKCNRTK